MSQLSLSIPLITIPILSALSSFILIFCLRFLDVFEREPYKYILFNFILGIVAYPLSISIYSNLSNFSNLSTIAIENSDIRIYISVVLSSIIMLISQLIAGLISFQLSKRQYDTVTDYIIYFSTIGIGYNFSEVFFYHYLNKTTNSGLLELSQNLYYSCFFSGTTLPFIMAGIGIGIYFTRISNKKNILLLGYILLIFSLLVQILYYSMNFFIMTGISSSTSPSDFISLIKEIKFFANSLSIMLLISGVGFAVLFDNFIISNFLNKVFTYSKINNTTIQKLNFLYNPLSYILSNRFRSILKITEDSYISDFDLKRLAKLALKNFNDNNNTSIYINEANSIINKIN
tara:strand:+ start:613 stop:1647 length:1035 start_codon:yes stop_codon:yes gene_type:complete